VGNWLDTRGHRRGAIVFFWLRVREPLSPITASVVRITPPSETGTPRVGPVRDGIGDGLPA
jgi:hypothetical protein